jgi:AraC-like DNA-binding protein
VTVKELLDLMDVRNPSHFIKEYKAFYGHTPGEYNRKCRKEWREQQKALRRKMREWKKARKKGSKITF